MATFNELDALTDVASIREVDKMFVRGLILVGLFLAALAVITSLGVQAIKKQNG